MRVVGQRHRLLLVAHLHDRHDRPEDLLAHDVHVLPAVGEHRRRELRGPGRRAACRRCAPWRPASTAASTRSSTISTCRSQVIEPVSMRAGRGSPWRSLRRDDLLHQLVVHRLMRVDALDRDADLALVGERAPHQRACAVRSRSASAQTIAGALPPSSSAHGISRSPQAAATFLPGRRRAGEDAVVDAAVDERRAGRAAPGAPPGTARAACPTAS